MYAGKTLIITGGTGSFGNAVLNRFLATGIGEIRIFSRDEKKQDDMRHHFQSIYPELSGKLRFYIFIAGVKSSLRDKVVAHCIEKGIQWYVTPEVSDIVMGGAEHM